MGGDKKLTQWERILEMRWHGSSSQQPFVWFRQVVASVGGWPFFQRLHKIQTLVDSFPPLVLLLICNTQMCSVYYFSMSTLHQVKRQPSITASPGSSFNTNLWSPVERSDLLFIITLNEVDNVRHVMEPRSVDAS